MITTQPKHQAVRLRAGDVHRALLGHSAPWSVLQQAYRLTPDHSDELLLLGLGRDFWVAARFGDRTHVWACHDLEAAEDTFDELLARGPGWKVASPNAVMSAA